MRRKAHFEKLPNLSLLFGYVFILSVMVLFGVVQYSSTKNLRDIYADLRILTLEASNYYEDIDFQSLLKHYHNFISREVLVNLQSTFDSPDGIREVSNIQELKENLAVLGRILDKHEADLSRSQTILLMTFIGLSIILSILLTVSEFDQVKKLEHEKSQRLIDQKLMDVLESERNLIAIELHDDVAQKLSVLSQHFESPERAEHSEILKRYNKDVIHKIRTMAQSLRSPDFRDLSFQKQLEFLFSDFRSITDIDLKAKFNGLSAIQLSDDMKLHIYRIIQELLTNCRKHSEANILEMNVLYVHPFLKLRYKDDGIGFSEKTERKGLGLRSIQYRLNILGGIITEKSENGLLVEIVIPVGI